MDFIVLSAGSYRIGWIVSYGMDYISKHWPLCAGWFATGWIGRMDWMGRWWDIGGMEGLTLAGAGTGAPPLALEGQRAVESGGWHQLHRCCKGAEYLCRRSKKIQIECTQIGTNT